MADGGEVGGGVAEGCFADEFEAGGEEADEGEAWGCGLSCAGGVVLEGAWAEAAEEGVVDLRAFELEIDLAEFGAAIPKVFDALVEGAGGHVGDARDSCGVDGDGAADGASDDAALADLFEEVFAGQAAEEDHEEGVGGEAFGEEVADAAGVLAPLLLVAAGAGGGHVRGLCGEEAELHGSEEVFDARGELAGEELGGVDGLIGHGLDDALPLGFIEGGECEGGSVGAVDTALHAGGDRAGIVVHSERLPEFGVFEAFFEAGALGGGFEETDDSSGGPGAGARRLGGVQLDAASHPSGLERWRSLRRSGPVGYVAQGGLVVLRRRESGSLWANRKGWGARSESPLAIESRTRMSFGGQQPASK